MMYIDIRSVCSTLSSCVLGVVKDGEGKTANLIPSPVSPAQSWKFPWKMEVLIWL